MTTKVNFSPMAIQILEKRYLLKDPSGKIIETPDEMLIRVAKYVCGENQELYNSILKIMRNKEFLPNTPTLMNADTTNMLSACFVIPVEDSLESIVHDALWYQAKIHQRGGGTGINFSNLRPEGDSIKSTGGISSGVMHFIRNFDTMSGSIHQGGKRDGANMTILSIYHPEIENFIKAKTEDNVNYENMNFSVLIDNNFMNALNHDQNICLSFPVKSIDGIRKEISAKYLWDLICESAWKCGCPGILFEDTINNSNPLDKYGFHITTTNPCGEQPLFCGKYEGEMIAESCNLGSINLSKFVNNSETGMDWDKLEEVTRITTEFLDLIIDRNVYPFEFIEKGTKLTRKIGLGVTGFSDYLIKIGVPYNSPRAIKEAREIMRFVTNMSHIASSNLAKILSEKYPLAELIKDTKRNNMCTTIAPTGTIGRLMLGHGYSSGIEPPFAISMKSSIIGTSIDDGIHPLLLEKINEICLGLPDRKKEIFDQIKQDGSSIQNISLLSVKIKELFLTANEISIEQHIAIQSAFQEFTDSAVSKTINLNNKASVNDVSKAFSLAWTSKCKGITIYRDGSKTKQVLNVIKEEIKIDNLRPIEDLAPRPPMLGALSFTKKTACNTLFINPTYLGNLDKTALECFIDANGGCTAMRTGLAVCISVYQRILETVNPELSQKGLDIVMTHLKNVRCQACVTQIEKEKHMKNVQHPVDSISCPAAVANVMKFMLEHKVETLIDGKPLVHDIKPVNLYSEPELIKCDECGLPLIRQGGCSSLQCPKCGKGGCN